MINFDNNYFFIRPISVAKGDMEFEVFSEGGNLMGTNVKGVSKHWFNSQQKKEEFEAIIEWESSVAEAKIRFLKEFHVPAEQWKNINLGLDTIFDIMENKWLISTETIASILI